MSLPVIYKGSDEVIQLTITDADGAPVVPSTVEDIIISVYQTKENVIQKWLLSEGTVDIFDDADGIVRVNLDRDNTEKIPQKRIYLEVAVETTNADFEDGVARQIQSDIPLCDLKNSVT